MTKSRPSCHMDHTDIIRRMAPIDSPQASVVCRAPTGYRFRWLVGGQFAHLICIAEPNRAICALGNLPLARDPIFSVKLRDVCPRCFDELVRRQTLDR